jgi:AcrR family transcriptional regulator
VSRQPDVDLSDLPPTARRLLAAAQIIVTERGYADLTMAALERESGANRALVSYYFGGKAGLVAALVESLFQNPDVGLVEEIRATTSGVERVERFIEYQRRVSRDERTNRLLYELLPHALRDPEVRERFAQEYRVYRELDADCLGEAPAELSEEEVDALAAVTIAVVEGLGIQKAFDPQGFDHERAWRAWRELLAAHLHLPAR